MHPVLAGSGAEALERIAEAERNGAPFALALLDCMMPNMDGFELAQRIQKLQPPQPALIMISSAARPDDVRLCNRLGIRRYLTKPVLHGDLLNTILEVVHEDLVTRREAPLVNHPGSAPLSILLAEDAYVNQRVVLGVLEREGHRVTIAANGREALDAWKQGDFDVVLMDIQMPEMDGFEATAAIRQAEQQRGDGSRTPIIAMTAAAMLDDRQRCLDSGMDDYISKPFHWDDLSRVLAANRGAPAPTHQGGQAPLDQPSAPETPLVDFNAAAQRVHDDHEMVRELAMILAGEAPGMLEALRNSLAHRDWRTLHRTAHSLKGSAAIFNSSKVVDLARTLEAAAAAEDLAQSSQLVQQLGPACQAMVDALQHGCQTA